MRLNKPILISIFCMLIISLVYGYNIYLLINTGNNVVLARNLLEKRSMKIATKTDAKNEKSQYFTSLVNKQEDDVTCDNSSAETTFGSMLNSYY